MRVACKEAHKSQPVWINVDHPGLEASVMMRVLASDSQKTVAIEWTESNMRALYRMCQNDNSRGEKRKAHRQQAKLGGAEGSGFFLSKSRRSSVRAWMAKSAVDNERHLPSHPPTLPSIHPSTLTPTIKGRKSFKGLPPCIGRAGISIRQRGRDVVGYAAKLGNSVRNFSE